MNEIRTPETKQEWDAYYDLRFRILRKPLSQPLGSEKHEGDATGIHFAFFEEGRIIAIARLDYQENNVAQIRFVAVESNLQAKGVGKAIMFAVEERCISDAKHKIILHARDYALDFYLKLNYIVVEKSYKLFDVLQHFLMEKKLN